MITGLVFTLFYIIGVKFGGMQPWFFGVSAEGIGTLGMIINFIVPIYFASHQQSTHKSCRGKLCHPTQRA
jgi:Na+(H+)/acetate symporter ActP